MMQRRLRAMLPYRKVGPSIRSANITRGHDSLPQQNRRTCNSIIARHARVGSATIAATQRARTAAHRG
jgi:hypothetical protein